MVRGGIEAYRTIGNTKVTVSIPAFDLFPHPRITPFCIFSHLFMHMLGTIPKGAINASA
jgi:hypothetical protein